MSQHSMPQVEVNFDGLVGPTHHYGGLSFGNLASTEHKHHVSYPKMAALQSLAKMWTIHRLGIRQAFIPPMRRPNVNQIAQLGFAGGLQEILSSVYDYSPALLSMMCSASSMWAANIATVSPSCHTKDGKVNITPANLASQFHRYLECPDMTRMLNLIFENKDFFTVHRPVLSQDLFRDDGSANHMYLCEEYGAPGVECFVYSQAKNTQQDINPNYFPARQTQLASEAIIRKNQIKTNYSVLMQQNPIVVDAGVFHNDVIALHSKNILIFHDKAYINFNINQWIESVSARVPNLYALCLEESDLNLNQSVKSYFFNSQIVSDDNNKMTLIMPMECQAFPEVQKIVRIILEADNAVEAAQYVDCGQSMQNGGGPACARLKVVMSVAAWEAIPDGFKLNEKRYHALKRWVNEYYPDQLTIEDLKNSVVIERGYEALRALEDIILLPDFYAGWY